MKNPKILPHEYGQRLTERATTETATGRDGSAPFGPENCSLVLVYFAEGRTEHVQRHALETPDAAEALEHALKCWLVYGCREVTLKREWRKPENDQAHRPGPPDAGQT